MPPSFLLSEVYGDKLRQLRCHCCIVIQHLRDHGTYDSQTKEYLLQAEEQIFERVEKVSDIALADLQVQLEFYSL